MADRSLLINEEFTIPADELELRFSRSRGSGGQNVNKVNTRVELRFALNESSALPEDVKARLRQRCRRRVSAEGILSITSQRYRDQSRNIDDAYSKLRVLILEVLEPPEERKPTRTPGYVKRKRLSDKRHRAQLKRSRRSAGDEG